jgi:biopolymer transport protein ExbD
LNKVRYATLAVAMAVALTSLSWYNSTAQKPVKVKKVKAKDFATVDLALTAHAAAVNGHEVKLKQIGDAIKKEVGADKAVIRIDCDPAVTMGTIFKVHHILRETGMYKVTYAGLSGDEMPLVLPSKEMIEKSKQLAAEDVLELKVHNGGKCVLAGAKVKPGTLPDQVRKRLENNEYLVVSLTMAADATYGDYLKTLKQLKLAKAERIFINEPGTI